MRYVVGIFLCFKANKKSQIIDAFDTYECFSNQKINLKKFKIFILDHTNR